MSKLSINDILKSSTNPFNDLKRQNDPHLPQFPFRLGAIGASGSGKTTRVIDMIHENMFYDRMIVIAAKVNEERYVFLEKICEFVSNERNESFKKYMNKLTPEQLDVAKEILGNELPLPFKFEYMFSDNADDLPDLKYYQEVYNVDTNKYEQLNTIVIFDDIQSMGPSAQKKFSDYFTRGRKYGISCIYIAQAYTKIPKDIRLNLTHLMIFEPTRADAFFIYRDQVSDLEKNEFVDMLLNTLDKKLDYIYFDKDASDISSRYRVNLEIGSIFQKDEDKLSRKNSLMKKHYFNI